MHEPIQNTYMYYDNKRVGPIECVGFTHILLTLGV